MVLPNDSQAAYAQYLIIPVASGATSDTAPFGRMS